MNNKKDVKNKKKLAFFYEDLYCSYYITVGENFQV